MKWEKVKLGDICKYVTSGGTPKSSIKEYYEPKQIPWLKTKEVNYCRIYETEAYISKDGLDNSSAKMIPQNSVIVAMYGQGDTAGRVAINKIPLTTNQACCNLIIDETKAYYEFVYYQLVTLYEKMVSLKNGGAQPNLNAAIIKSMEIKLPPLKTQRYIADILSSYDNLIENNQKQIKLLEEAAQRLYKEWFVDLRFPGHENTKIVDGVPEGWNICPFSSKVDIMSGGTPKTSIPDYYNGRIPFYTPKDSDGAFFAYKTQMNITEGGLKNCNSRLYPPKTVIITARGTVGKTTILAVPMAMNQSCYALKMKENDAPYYLFFALNNEIKALQTMANGGVFNTIIGKTFDSINIQIPKDSLIYGFEETVRPFMGQIKNKLQANSKLVEARNRLLLKMMNGEVEV